MSQEAEVSVGAYWVENQERIEWNVPSQKTDSTLPVYRFTVDLSAGDNRLTYIFRRTHLPIRVDGHANEKSWKSVVQSPKFASASPSDETHSSVARIVYDENFLYVFIQTEDDRVFSYPNSNHEGDRKDDEIKIWIDSDKESPGYWEFQVDSRNRLQVSWITQLGRETLPLKDVGGLHSAVAIGGDRPVNEGWNVEMAIPLAFVQSKDVTKYDSKPNRIGEHWRLNAMRLGPSFKGEPRNVAWVPFGAPDKHSLSDMFDGVFADEKGRVNPIGKRDPGFN